MTYLHIILWFIAYFLGVIITYIFTRHRLAIENNGLILDCDRDFATGVAIFWPISIICIIFSFIIRLLFSIIPEWCFNKLISK